jgi:hypothetical protein
MNFSYKHLLPEDFNDDTRVWIYQCNRSFTPGEESQIKNLLTDLVANWQSHGVPVKGSANILFHQFIVLMADEAATGVSGCSIDSSVRVIQEIEKQFNVDMFNWQSLAFIVNDEVRIVARPQFNDALENGLVNPQTLFFNNVVSTKKELEDKWMIPVSESWLKTKIKQPL